MKLKKYLTLGIGIITGFGLSAAGLSYASQNRVNNVNLITSEKAKSIMLNKVPEANILEFSYDGDNKIPKYDGTLIKDDYQYEIDVNAKTGDILKFEKEKISISNNKPNSSNFITEEKAKTIMLDKVPGATILEFSYDGDDKIPKYDGTLMKDGYEYEVDVNAKTGDILKFEKENNSTDNSTNGNNNSSTNNKPVDTKPNSSQNNTSYIGESKAKSIMLSKVPGATINKFYLDKDSTPEYEGELIKGDVKYDISVDAITGVIKEFSQEKIYTNSNNSNDNDRDDDIYDNDRDDDIYDNDDDDIYDNDDDDIYDNDSDDSDDDDDRYDD